jgi:hypothetical protein
MEKSVLEIRELAHHYGLSLALTRKVCEYFDTDEEIKNVLSDLSHSSLITDSGDIFASYLENHPELRKK